MDIRQDMPTLAERSDLAPRARHLLAQQLAECGDLIDPVLRGTLDDLELELFRIAQQSSGGQVQHEALDARGVIQRTRPRFRARLMAALEARFARIGDAQPAPPAAAPQGADDLALVDPEALEESIALDDLASRSELRAGNPLNDLGHRYAVLIAAPPLAGEALPPGPHALAGALAETATDLGLGRAHRLLFYRLCDRRLTGAAESIYARLNEHLKAAGILPDLRGYRAPRPQRGEWHPTPDAAPEDLPLEPTVDYTAPAQGPLPTAVPEMGELHGLLDARRHALHPGAAAHPAGPAALATVGELQQALAVLQALRPATTAPRPGDRLAQDFRAALQRSATAGQAVQLPPEQRDALELIGLLYDQLIPATRADSITRQLLGGLQIPLLRVAMTDSRFFTVRSHPARRLLNAILDTASLWLDRSGEAVDAALKLRLQRSVQRLAEDPNGDLAVIEREADELEAHLRLLARRAQIAERRQVEAATGRDRLQEARASARREIDRRLAAHPTTALVRALLENAWTDALTLALLRKGTDSDTWNRWLHVADELVDPKPERDADALAAELHQGLTQVGLQPAEAELVASYALGAAPPATNSYRAAPPSQTEVLVRLKSRRPPEEEEPAAPAATEATPEPPPLTPAEQRALEALQQLPFGTWMDYTVNQQGETVAYKLAWYGPRSGHCLLVNARGTAAPQRTLDQVARLMARGQIRVAKPRSEGGLLDRAWAALLSGLRKFSVSDTRPEPVT